MSLQMAMFPPDTEWVPPFELPDLTGEDELKKILEENRQ